MVVPTDRISLQEPLRSRERRHLEVFSQGVYNVSSLEVLNGVDIRVKAIKICPFISLQPLSISAGCTAQKGAGLYLISTAGESQ